MGDLWQRMGVTPDKSTWHSERIDVPGRDGFKVSEFAPKAWATICDLLGGEDRIEEGHGWWDDSFIVNLGTREGAGKVVPGLELDGWHVDGDTHVHYLDSGELGLLVIPLFTDIKPDGGGTTLCPAALPHIAEYLYQNPAGVSPEMVPRAEDPHWNKEPARWRLDEIVKQMPADSFLEATGKAGDVYFLHPLMAHSASNNTLRDLRVINNPNVTLRHPFNFDRRDGSQYSVVEMTTRNMVGADRLRGWQIRGHRERVLSNAEKDSKPTL